MHDPEVVVMVANDAAGEGVKLQRAHLMVNYDLPWNPNRLEQRFGRIHRIGQTEVCHLWNLVAKDTREGEVYGRLLEKLETARSALGGRVYDVLGRLFEGAGMRDLLMDAGPAPISTTARSRTTSMQRSPHGSKRTGSHYLRRPFRAEPDFDAVSVTYNLRELLARAEAPQ